MTGPQGDFFSRLQNQGQLFRQIAKSRAVFYTEWGVPKLLAAICPGTAV